MNHKTLTISMLLISFVAKAELRTNFCKSPKKIPYKAIATFDNTDKMDVQKTKDLEASIKAMQNGEILKFEGKKINPRKLAEMEKTPKGRSSKVLKSLLNEAIAYYAEISRPYLKDARAYKSIMVALIKKWAENRQVKASILAEWGNQSDGHEIEQLKKLAPTFEDFDNLLSDLLCFLTDLRFSCPASMQAYFEELEKKRAKKTPKTEL